MQENEEQLVDFERLQQLVSERSILWREHALQRLNERRLSKADVKAAILSGEVIEDYPDAYPTPSCLVLGCTVGGKWIHVVCGGHNLLAFDRAARYYAKQHSYRIRADIFDHLVEHL